MKKFLGVFFSALMVLSLIMACAPAAVPTTSSPVAKVTAPAAVSKAAWEQEWENTLAAAKKEGSIDIYALWRPPTRAGLAEAFRGKFDINLEFTPFGRGTEMVAKIKAEQRNGLYMADIFGAGTGTIINMMKPEGLLGPIEPFLILPEVTNPKVWAGGNFPFLDKEKQLIGMISNIQRAIPYNTEKIKKGEITSYKDLLKPEYKGKIVMDDPTVSGAANGYLAFMALNIWNVGEVKEFLKQLIVKQEVVFQRDRRVFVESVARGKFAIGFGASGDVLAEFQSAGAPLDVAFVKEGTRASSMSGIIGVPTKIAHPNAAKVFTNWLLTKEGQTIFARSFASASQRVDVSTEGIPSIFLPQPGEKIFLETEEFILFQAEMLEISKKIVSEASKK